MKQPSLKKEAPTAPPSVAASEKKGNDRPTEKERKKDIPAPRMQFDDKSRVEKAKKRAVVNQTEARNRVELFRHLPQYEHGTQLPDLQSKMFQLDPVHPAVYKVHIWGILLALFFLNSCLTTSCFPCIRHSLLRSENE